MRGQIIVAVIIYCVPAKAGFQLKGAAITVRVEITRRCSAKYTALLRLYCGMTAFIAVCASVALGMWGWAELSFTAAGVCAVMCCAAVVVPLSFGRITYLRSGGCIKIEKGRSLRPFEILITLRPLRGLLPRRLHRRPDGLPERRWPWWRR